MLWIVVIVMYCLQTVEGDECNKSEIIVGRLGEVLVLNFPLFDLRDQYDKSVAERYGHTIIQKEIQIQDLIKESLIRFKNKMDSTKDQIMYTDGKPTYLAGNQTEIFVTNNTFVVNKTDLQKEDAGVYWIVFRSIRLGQKALIITGKPTIKGQSPPNPVLKAEDNYTTILQLECHSFPTSIGYCQLVNNSMYMWYRNGMRMTDMDPTLSQINVTVDHNGGDFTCLATEYRTCYNRLQTTKHYADGLKIEECDNVYESETFIVKPQYAPIYVKIEPDQKEITVNKNEDWNVRCSAKCHPKCDIKWGKDFQDLKSSELVTITESMFGNELRIVNISSSDEGVYSCLVSNIHGEVKMSFTLSVIDKKHTVTYSVVKNNQNGADMNTVIVTLTLTIIIVIIVVISVIMYKRYNKENNDYLNAVPVESSSEEGIYETIDDLLPGTAEDNNFRNGEQNQEQEDIQYGTLGVNTPHVYTQLTQKRCRHPEILNKILN